MHAIAPPGKDSHPVPVVPVGMFSTGLSVQVMKGDRAAL